MNETTLEDILKALEYIDKGESYNEIILPKDTAIKAKRALDKMLELS